MELEEAIKNVRKFNQENRYRDCGKINNSIDMVLQALDNSIPKEKVKKKIEELSKQIIAYRKKCNGIEYIISNELAIKILQELLEE